MTLDRLSQITEVGIKSGITLRNINVESAYVSGVVTATTLNVTGSGANFSGVVTATSFVGNLSGNINSTGVSTFAGITTVTGATLFTKQINASGVITATSFSGSGTNLTGLPSGYNDLDNMLFG